MEQSFGEKIAGKHYRERVGAYAVSFDDQGRVALVEAPAAHTKERWLFLPGGGIEPGESDEACIRRECLEETGHFTVVGEPICIGREYVFSEKSGDYMYLTGHCYRVAFGEKVQKPIETDHTLMWVPARDCYNKMFLKYQAWAIKVALGEGNL